MAGVEGLQEYGLTFLFEDGTDTETTDLIIDQVVNDRYEDVDELATQEMGGTTYLAFFRSSGEMDRKSVLDPEITWDEFDARMNALFHILNKF